MLAGQRRLRQARAQVARHRRLRHHEYTARDDSALHGTRSLLTVCAIYSSLQPGLLNQIQTLCYKIQGFGGKFCYWLFGLLKNDMANAIGSVFCLIKKIMKCKYRYCALITPRSFRATQ